MKEKNYRLARPVSGDFGEAEMRRWWKARDFIGSIPETLIGPEVSRQDAAAAMIAALSGKSFNQEGLMEEQEIYRLFDKWAKKLRVVPAWDVKLEFVDDPAWPKTGDIKIDCDDRKAIVLLNRINPKQENPEEILVHELLHLKLYPLDQVTEALIPANFPENSPARDFAYTQFFTSLEQTVEELSKCFLLEFGENRRLSFGRCALQSSFDDLFNGLKKLE